MNANQLYIKTTDGNTYIKTLLLLLSEGLIKIHKTDFPIRPIVNWLNGPAYKLAKTLSKKLPTPHLQCNTFNPVNK
jgi:hypothetical protein